jgi:transcriptional regulator with XRE-family HTH domain
MQRSSIPIHPLAQAREDKNLSQKALADATGLSEKTIWSAENGKPVGPYTRKKLCKYFKKTAQELGLVVKKRKNDISAENLPIQVSEQTNDETNKGASLEHDSSSKSTESSSLAHSHTNTIETSQPSSATKDDILMAEHEAGSQDLNELRRKILEKGVEVIIGSSTLIIQIPFRSAQSLAIPSTAEKKSADADDILFQILLAPSLATVKLSYLLWLADGQNIPLTENLANLTVRLEDALTKYHGQFLKPAQQVLAHTHDMQGKIAFDQLQYAKAVGHFQEMFDLGVELNDPNIICLAQIHRADILRKRGRYEAAVSMLDALQSLAESADDYVQGVRWQILARAHSAYGNKAQFLDAIDHAEAVAASIKETIDTQYNQFNLVEILQERAQGHSMLWQPEKALTIYDQTDTLKPFRPIREMGSYMIIKAQAHAYSGDINKGVKLAIEGIEFAKSYKSRRHISRAQIMYERLSATPLGKHPRMKDLKEALMSI